MRFEHPIITDHGSIVENTFTRCSTSNVTGDWAPPKDKDVYGHDKFGECSSGHS